MSRYKATKKAGTPLSKSTKQGKISVQFRSFLQKNVDKSERMMYNIFDVLGADCGFYR
jgi:hypothetical protein